jgi:signal peptidase I
MDNGYETPLGRLPFDEHDIYDVISHPDRWNHTPLFDRRRSVVFTLGKDQFFPMGDNSPQSRDARVWGDPPFVRRELLAGKALFVYWPHAWRWPTPLLPNFRRFRFIR